MAADGDDDCASPGDAPTGREVGEREQAGFATCMAAAGRFLRANSIRGCSSDDLLQETALRLLEWVHKGGRLREASGVATARHVWLETLRDTRRVPRCASDIGFDESRAARADEPVRRTDAADFAAWLKREFFTPGDGIGWQLILEVFVDRRSVVRVARDMGISRHVARRELAASARILARVRDSGHY